MTPRRSSPRPPGTPVAFVPPVQRFRPLWVRDLCLYREGALDPSQVQEGPGPGPQVRTRFRSTTDPECFALYSVRDGSGQGRDADPPSLLALENHTLVVVREFRRVPLHASGLAMLLFTAQPGGAARVIATLAHWVERAVSGYQPAYLLLAHSLEQPATSVLLAAVHEPQALQWARPSPLSLDAVLPEVRPWLDAEPERYVYCPDSVEHSEAASHAPRPLSPFAV